MRRLVILPLVLAAALLGLAGGCRSLSKEELEERLLALPKNAPLRARGLERIALPSGLTLPYWHLPARGADADEPTRPTLVLVHGTPASLCDWVEVLYAGSEDESGNGPGARASLAERFEVFAPDLPGHGLAPGGGDDLTFQTVADHLTAFLSALDLRDVVLVGHSYGGEFAWRAALDAPERVIGLVLVDSSGYPRPDDGWMPEEEAMRERSLAKYGWLLNSRERIRSALAVQYERGLPDDRVEEMFLLCENAANWRSMVALCRDENGTRASALPELEAPTLLIWGGADRAYPPGRTAERFARDLSRAELVVLEGLGHYPHAEDPKRVAGEIARFAASL